MFKLTSICTIIAFIAFLWQYNSNNNTQITEQQQKQSTQTPYATYTTTPNPTTSKNHTQNYSYVPNYLTTNQHAQIMRFFQENITSFPVSHGIFPPSQVYPHIGEAVDPIVTTTNNNNSVYSCPEPHKYPYLRYNRNTHQCQFANRVDLMPSFLSGGYNGWKETIDIHRARATLFKKYDIETFDEYINYNNKSFERDEYKWLFFENELFHEIVSRQFCDVNKYPYLKPFQITFNIQLPGQALPIHRDSHYFFGASQELYPAWLVIVMQESGLFEQMGIKHFQTLVYVHDWDDEPISGGGSSSSSSRSGRQRGGDLILWPYDIEYNKVRDNGVALPALPRSAIFFDGSETVHGTSTFEPDQKPFVSDDPFHDQMILKWEGLNDETRSSANVSSNALKHGGFFRLYVNGNKTENIYSWNDIRANIVFRGWCFATEEQRDSFNPYKNVDKNGNVMLSLEGILDRLKVDLIENKKVVSKEELDKLSEYELGLLLMNSYVKLPNSKNAIIPFNYCVLFKLVHRKVDGYSYWIDRAIVWIEDAMCGL